MKNLRDLVTDWGGFEKLVTKLHETGKVEVQHDVKLVGKSGASRQVDVLVRHREGLYEHLIIVECKHWKTNVCRQHVDALTATVSELNAARGVIFSTKGFQAGAVTQARHVGIDLFKVRELTDEEWGLPGRVVDFFVQVVQCSIGNPAFDETQAFLQLGYAPSSLRVDLKFGPDGPLSSSRLIESGRSPGETLESEMLRAVDQGLVELRNKSFLFDDGATGVFFLRARVDLKPLKPYMVTLDRMLLEIKRMSFDLGIKVDQSRFTLDRGDHFLFALAVENCVTGDTSTASRIDGGHVTQLGTPRTNGSGEMEKALVNGSILKIFVKPMFEFREIEAGKTYSLATVQVSA